MNKTVLTSFIILCLFSTVFLVELPFDIQTVKAVELIYIRADGSIEPTNANITTSDSVTYTFTGNNYERFIIERNNIVVDGSGYTLEGPGYGYGISLHGIGNVTVKDLEIKEFNNGINLYNSSNNKFYENNITNNNNHGFYIYQSSNNIISGNRVTNNGGYSYTGQTSIYVSDSFNNTISLNNITDNTHLHGIQFWGGSSNNTINENNIANNYYGIRFFSSNGNYFYGNNITGSHKEGIFLFTSSNNTFYNNLLTGNGYGLSVHGWELDHYLNHINTSNLVDGKPIYYLINQHNLTVNPSTHPEVGFLAFINSTETTIEGQDLMKNGQGLLLVYTNNSRVTDCNIMNNYDGLVLFSSFNNSIDRNTIVANSNQGIYLWGNSSNNRISENQIVSNNYQGIYLSDSSNNTLYGNTIANSEYGIELDGLYNSINLNNFINNTIQIDSYNSVNFWDNGVEGNYWSNFNGTDSDNDGIGDIPYEIDSNNNDSRPLMGMFSSFNTSLGKNVNVISNSTIEDFEYFSSNSTIRMRVSNMTRDQTYGFVRITILHTLMTEPYNVTIDGANPTYWNYTLHDNGTHRWIYFEYEHSTLEIVIIPEFPSIIILPLFIVASLLAVAMYRRKRAKPIGI